MPKIDRMEKAVRRLKVARKDYVARNSGRVAKPLTKHNTPVNKPKDHMSYTYMNKLGQGLKSINKTKKIRFR